MRILIDPSGYTANNHGDMAMFIVALDRLRTSLPDSEIAVINSEADAIAARHPGVRCIRPVDRAAFFSNMLPGRVLRRTLPASAASTLLGTERKALVRYPSLWSRTRRLRLASQRVLAGGGDSTHGDPVRYYQELRAADVLVLSGAGLLNDSFGDHALTVLEEIEIAVRHGIPVYMLGQGFGPISRADLWRKARQVLPLVNRICLRERRRGPALLAELGVRPDRIAVTGDDAVGLALRLTPPVLGTNLGVNLRVAHYSGLDGGSASAVGEVIRAAARKLGAPLCPVPVSRFASSDDLQHVYRSVIGTEPPPEALARETVEDVIRAAGRCRVAVTASYHAAVFALSQGVSAVCLARSDYYDDKFFGLQDMFGTGCEVVRLDDEAGPQRLGSAIEKAWERAETARSHLLAQARRQAQDSRSAYERLAAELSRRSAGQEAAVPVGQP